MASKQVILSWSGGKDSALALHRLRSNPDVTVVGLLTTITREYDRISIHGVRRTLLQQQAAALGLPVHEVELTPSATNDQYQAAWRQAIETLPPGMRDADCIAFGDIFLEDVRAYREAQARELGYEVAFPLWGEATHKLMDEVLRLKFVATLVCVDTEVLPASFAGRTYDAALLADLPPHIDPCGENGEFHTFVSDGPGFSGPLHFGLGDTIIRDNRFAFCDLAPVGSA